MGVGAEELVACSQFAGGCLEDVVDLTPLDARRAPALGAFKVAIPFDVIEFEDSQIIVAAVQAAAAELSDGADSAVLASPSISESAVVDINPNPPTARLLRHTATLQLLLGLLILIRAVRLI